MTLLLSSNPSIDSNFIKIVVSLSNAPYAEQIITKDNAKTNESFSKDPFQTLPLLDSEDGVLSKATAIARYIARKHPGRNLYGTSPLENSLTDQWLDFVHGGIVPAAKVILLTLTVKHPDNKQVLSSTVSELKEKLMVIERHLSLRTYLSGNGITIADAALLSALTPLFQILFDEGFRKAIPNISRWWHTITELKEIKDVLGKAKFCKAKVQPAI